MMVKKEIADQDMTNEEQDAAKLIVNSVKREFIEEEF